MILQETVIGTIFCCQIWEQKVEKVLTELYEYYLIHIEQMSNFYLQLAYQEGRDRAVTDYISGMSDEFAIRTFEDVFVPRKWHVL